MIFAAILSGCTSINYQVNQDETDVVKFADETRKAYDQSKNAIDSVLSSMMNTSKVASSYIQDKGDRREVLQYWEPAVPSFQSNAVSMSGAFIQQQFTRICANNGGHYANGWCVNQSADVPLFWAQAIDRNPWVRMCSSCQARQVHKIAMAVYAPSGTASDAAWQKFAYSQGFRSATQRKEESKMLLGSKGRGASVCHIVSQGVSPGAATVERGYVEDANNGKLKIRIVAKGYLDESISEDSQELGDSTRTKVANETNIWASPDSWFVCK